MTVAVVKPIGCMSIGSSAGRRLINMSLAIAARAMHFMLAPLRPGRTAQTGSREVVARIVDLLAPHGHNLEPFAIGGSLAGLLSKAPTRLETVSDVYQDLVVWKGRAPRQMPRLCHLWNGLRPRS